MLKLAILVPTYNRERLLRRTLSSLLAQVGDASAAELIVIDNNSSDGTAAVCREFRGVRYVFEPRQGLSYARNAGIEALSGMGPDDVVAFVDDDVEAAPGWLEAMRRAFVSHPGVDCVGGRVLPQNSGEFPDWITSEHWAPLALQDHGSQSRVFSRSSPIGLIGANFACRKRVFDRIGGFSADVQRVKDGIGSTEDHEFLARVYASGGTALYTPDVLVITRVPPERMSRDYHRRWHRGHGRFHAVMRTSELEQAKRRLLGVPAHLFRSAGLDALAWLRGIVTRDTARAFAAETRLWFFSGFLKERCACLARR
jgi:glycosyltransferase involved in cell wall biosynthesis